jgi:hypothetical protein
MAIASDGAQFAGAGTWRLANCAVQDSQFAAGGAGGPGGLSAAFGGRAPLALIRRFS